MSAPDPQARPSAPPRSRSFFDGAAPKRALKSFDNLVSLANDQEALRQAARKLVWRDRGEPVTQLNDLHDCLVHAAKGAARAGGLAFGIRSGVNLFLLLFRVFRTPKDLRFAIVRHAVLGPDSVRFGAMIGSFVAIYKFLYNAIPLVSSSTPSSPLPADSLPLYMAFTHANTHLRVQDPILDRRVVDTPEEVDTGTRNTTGVNTPGALSAKALEHQLWVRKKGLRRHAFFAGALAGGVAILFERRDRRVGIAQQLFVRGLQGSYNYHAEKRGIRIPHGDVIVFTLACAQIMYAYTMRPDTIPRGYNLWIQEASKTVSHSVHANRTLTRDHTLDVGDLQSLLSGKTRIPTARNRSALVDLINTAQNNPAQLPHHGSCAIVHPWMDSCTMVQIERFIEVFTWMVPIYGALHLIPTILFKRHVFFKKPAPLIGQSLLNTMRSSTFLAVFVIIFQGMMCVKSNLYEYLSSPQRRPFALPQWLLQLLITKPSYWVLGAMTGMSLFVEAPRRRGELAMYVMPKALESYWTMYMRKLGVKKIFRGSESLFTAVAMGMFMSTYQNSPEHLSGYARRIMYQLMGPN
ncbi:hypothetical protein AURDEDRAFT_180722 [Auricularia subglabra TFB-10046 SS5]|nr:hypothetical protein AURDEDRAFT_180722 [Auricularia subglabra TFB-10046 SS5]